MSTRRQKRAIPNLPELPRPIYARPESWGPEGRLTDWHSHKWGQFSYAVSGVLNVSTEQASYVSPPQYGIWIPENTTHKVESNVAAEMRSLYINMDALAGDQWKRPFTCEVSVLCRELIVRFCQSPALYDVGSREERLAQVMIDELGLQPEVATDLPMPTDHRLILISEFLIEEPSCALDINQLGSKVGLSGRSVSRLFKQETGLTFQQWRQRVRLSTALTWLESGVSVTEVAVSCGYDSLSAFVVAFKSQFGQTPGQMF
ncbi:AraC family transcriptional regulator [Vibrio marisflavi]|uniref:HTH-type transcriptional regulator NimR n=1 Tax=Vibrio marisflavi CECT 7928 TaxID=634439 RepID=A0ABM8ZYM0_9VIBR|nr:helix-turn-helix transcriptional regulator [Vibrio marisflavi]CAH0536052.1 HTH-type transcriptional regulator NimR [Vibrio marisflavi CECT 7928]